MHEKFVDVSFLDGADSVILALFVVNGADANNIFMASTLLFYFFLK